MLYREAGQFKTSYQTDMAVFPIRQDVIGIALIVAAAYALPPMDPAILEELSAFVARRKAEGGVKTDF